MIRAQQNPFVSTQWGGPAAIVIGDMSTDDRDVVGLLEATGWRVVSQVPSRRAESRLRDQSSVGLVWFEAGVDEVDPLLLGSLKHHAAMGHYSAVVSFSSPLLDEVATLSLGSDLHLLVDASDIEKAALAASVNCGAATKHARVSDIASGKGDSRLKNLRLEVRRLSSALAHVSQPPTANTVVMPTKAGSSNPAAPFAPTAEFLYALIEARRSRSLFIPASLLADPGWDILLELLLAEITQRRVSISDACIAANVPATTGLRWLNNLLKEGLISRRDDPYDSRRSFVALTQEASEKLRAYFQSIEAGVPGI